MPASKNIDAMRVLISGSGIAGPTLAWFLAKAGANITIVEKSDTFLAQGQNIDIRGVAIKVIRKMGLLDEVRRFNTTEKGLQFIDPSGRPFAPFPVTDGSAQSFTSEFEILRGDLALVLYNATKDLPNVNYVFGTTVTNVISNDDDSVKVELSDGKVEEFDILVAADGQWSRIRKQCFPPESIKVIDKSLYVAYWTIPRLPSDNDWCNLYQALGSRGISVRPDPHGTMRAVCTRMICNETQRKAWQEASRGDRQTQEDLMRREFGDAGWQTERFLDAMDQAPDFYFQAVQQIRMSKWSQGRVVCLGDAAHAPTPLTGMGTSLAIDGAYILAGELSKLDADVHPSKALEAYENAFRPFVDKIQKIPFFVPAIVHPETAWKRWLLHTFASGVSKVAAISWLANLVRWIGSSEDKDDFPLPPYPKFDDVEH